MPTYRVQSCIALCAVTASLVHAQTLEEVVVTATRRAAPLQDIPVSVSVLSGSEVRAAGVRDIADVADRFPALAFTDEAFGGSRILIRGIASGTFIETRPLTALYFDETPVMALFGPQWGGARPEFVDLARVEVLRGPQGALFGAGALGGAVRLIPNAPDPEGTAGSVAATLSETAHGDGNYEFEGVLNVPVAREKAAIRVVAYSREDAGFLDNIARSVQDANSVEMLGGRASLLWRPTPELHFTLRAQRQVRTTGGLNGADVSVAPYEQFRPTVERDDDQWNLFTLTAGYSTPRTELLSITSYLDREPRFAADVSSYAELFVGPLPTSNDFDDSLRDFMQELRFTASVTDRLKALAGAYYQDQTRAYEQTWITPGYDALHGGAAASFGFPDRPFYALTSGEMHHRALYGEIEFDISPAWRASAGARWFEFEQGIENINDGVLIGSRVVVTASSSERGVTPRFALEYRPSAQLLAYASAAQGFRPGGTNDFTDLQATHCAPELAALGFPTPPRGFESDTLWDYEIGVKSSWLKGTLMANASIFAIDWSDMQTFRVITCAAPDDMGFVDNAGKASSEGVELELTWAPTETFGATVGAAYVNARLREDAPSVAGEDGERIATVPDWNLRVTLSKQFQITGRVSGFMRADYRYTAGSWSDFDESLRRWQATRQLTDVMLGIESRGWRAELFAENIFDERGVLVHPNNLIGEWEVLTRPRTIGVRARIEL
ncbi:MAG TPA: TonB-dependent receptor [Steroidobacter sp.]|jgi:iron complex outermembrane recepter protein|nr:TonB-dependent receptor [Steroidobacter sp.]